MEKLGIERRRTTAYHPACNGAIERFHRSLKNSLRAQGTTRSWFEALPLALLGIRNTINEQGYSPAKVLYGANVELPVIFFVPTKPDFELPSAEFLEKNFHSSSYFSGAQAKS